ncbi:MAG: hypothetical protein PHR83_11020 [Paludibacter sp.]|nr:hypothetical protein [Paludibacter sp.]
MKRLSISTVLLLLVLLPAFGQNEVFFSNISDDSIKVESLKGIEIHTELTSMFSQPFPATPVYIGYFSEKRIAAKWTLTSSIGLYNNFHKTFDFSTIVFDSINSSYYFYGNLKTKNAYSLILTAGIEPRCYWTYKNRYRLGLSQLNSGWFLSCPLTLNTLLLNSPEPFFNQGWLPSYFSVAFSVGPKLGYRQAISKQLFLEASAGLNIGTSLYIANKQLQLSIPNVYPQVTVKAAYTFK